MQNGYVILGIHGDDPTTTANTARVRLFVDGEATDQDFQLPALNGADPQVAPSNFVTQYEAAIGDQITAALAQLGGSNGTGQ